MHTYRQDTIFIYVYKTHTYTYIHMHTYTYIHICILTVTELDNMWQGVLISWKILRTNSSFVHAYIQKHTTFIYVYKTHTYIHTYICILKVTELDNMWQGVLISWKILRINSSFVHAYIQTRYKHTYKICTYTHALLHMHTYSHRA